MTSRRRGRSEGASHLFQEALGIGHGNRSRHRHEHGNRVRNGAPPGAARLSGVRGDAKPRQAEPLRKAAAEESLPVEIIELDVTSGESIDNAFAAVAAAGPVDVLVNNAGIGGATPLELTPEDEHRRMFETNYFGAIGCIHAVLRSMRERRRGTIVNVTSIAGLVPIPNQVAYSASKWALECAGEALAHEVVRFGVRVVNIEPGVVDDEHLREFLGDHALRQDLALPAGHAAQREILLGRDSATRRRPTTSPR